MSHDDTVFIYNYIIHINSEIGFTQTVVSS